MKPIFFMISQLFKRKVSFYANFCSAFHFFTLFGSRVHIWLINIHYLDCSSTNEYSLSPFVVPRMFFGVDVDFVFVERYTRSRFDVDLSYFKSFLASCSSFQLDVLRSDSRFVSLLNYIENGENC